MPLRRAVISSGDALLATALRGWVSWQLMKDGRFAESEWLAVRTAESVEPRGDACIQDLSVYGTLLVRVATAAARDDRGAIAADFLASAGVRPHRLRATFRPVPGHHADSGSQCGHQELLSSA